MLIIQYFIAIILIYIFFRYLIWGQVDNLFFKYLIFNHLDQLVKSFFVERHITTNHSKPRFPIDETFLLHFQHLLLGIKRNAML